MYVPNRGDYVQAFDAKTGALLWEYQRQFPEGVNGGTNRNLAIWGTTLIDAGGDNTMYALDARTGKIVWETPVLDPTLPARASSGPIVANGKVITGRQCQPAATHESCVITAHDAATGKELWRTRWPAVSTSARAALAAASARRDTSLLNSLKSSSTSSARERTLSRMAPLRRE
jgi:alcohol dehydrogenase (cytochrome c)